MFPSKHSFYFLAVVIIALLAISAGLESQWPVIADYGTKLPTRPLNDNLDLSVCGLDSVLCPNEKVLRVVTAYNVGDVSQTDSTPCIGATGEDLCEALKNGEKIVATNELPLGSKVMIAGDVYTVKDRTNGRYHYRYDVAFPVNEHDEAVQFGSKYLEIVLL